MNKKKINRHETFFSENARAHQIVFWGKAYRMLALLKLSHFCSVSIFKWIMSPLKCGWPFANISLMRIIKPFSRFALTHILLEMLRSEKSGHKRSNYAINAFFKLLLGSSTWRDAFVSLMLPGGRQLKLLCLLESSDFKKSRSKKQKTPTNVRKTKTVNSLKENIILKTICHIIYCVDFFLSLSLPLLLSIQIK